MKYTIGWLAFFFLISSEAFSYNVSIHEIEPNNTKNNANLLPYAWTIKRGNISSLYDSDWYKVSVGGPSSLTIEMSHQVDNYQYNLFILSVYNSNDDLLSQTYSYAPDEVTSFDVGLGSAGEYYIVVQTACENDSGQCEYHRSDEYQLTVSVFSTDKYIQETEPNNSMADADDYSNGGILTGQLSSKSDEDFYFLNLSSAADIIVVFLHAGDQYQYNLFYVEILDSNNNVINSTDIYAPDDLTKFGFSVSTAGKYYIKVTGCQSGGRCDIHGTDQYTIKTLISPLNDLTDADYETGYTAGRQACIEDPVSCGIGDTLIFVSDNPVIQSGAEITAYGNSEINTITLKSQAKANLINFPNANEIIIQENYNIFQVYRSGTIVTFQGSDGTELNIPATKDVQIISFNDRSLTLSIYDNQVMLDDQVIGLGAQPIY